jgi:tRNA G37 N-methylase TrmD
MKKLTQPAELVDEPSNFIYLTLFPQLFDTYFQTSMAQKARQKGHLNYHVYNIRD